MQILLLADGSTTPFYFCLDCGIAQAKPQSRIIGGNDAMYGEFPWQVCRLFFTLKGCIFTQSLLI